MRNLNFRICEVDRLDLGSCETSNWYPDPDTRAIFILNGSNIYKVNQNQDPQVLIDLTACGYVSPSVSCIGLCGIPDMTCLLLGLSTGELLQVDTECGELEEVGAVAAGLLAIAMSPDYDLISLVTKQLNVITMTRDFLPVSETPLQQSSFGEGEFVNVGWGTKETQFHGSEGKESRDKKVEVGSVTEKDDGRVRISWRGDGQMFCVSFVTTNNPRRLLLVLSRAGALYSTSENCPGLEHALAWRPSGNLIATTVKKQNKHVVAFFEKNGLQHGEFSLRKEAEVLEVEWNSDSSVLLVLTRVGTDHELEFWSVSNYHWYLKQSICLQGSVLHPRWHQEDPSLLQFLHMTEGGVEIHSYRLAWDTDASKGLGDEDLAVVAVVDGSVVKVTPFRQAVVPPPLSAFEVHVQAQVKQLAFTNQPGHQHQGATTQVLSNASQDSNSFLIVTNKDEFIVMGLSETGEKLGGGEVKVTGAGGNGYTVKTSVHSVLAKLKVKWGEVCYGQYATNYTWVGDTVLASVCQPSPCLLVMKQTSPDLVTVVETIPVEEPVYSIMSRPEGAVVQLQDGTLLEFSLLEAELVPALESFPRLCCYMVWTPAGVLGLTSRYRLYLHSTELANNVTSMWMHSDFLLVTTMDHQLLALPRNSLGEGTPRWQEAGKRRVERGSRIVCAVPNESRTVLQMPRGNLETIQPRSLSVLLVGGLLKKLQYREAFILARRQRINLNLLVDHDYDEFIKNVKEFVCQVGRDPQHLCIFIADLQDEDVCSTMYSAQYEGRSVVKPSTPKVESVCKVVREELERLEESEKSEHKTSNILPILATLVRDGGKLEEALLRIKSARDAGLAAVADDALHFLLYMVDVNVLFDVALGTYDFDLVIMVAEKSQKDPKEYLPFLNSFKKMDEDYRKFSIDKHLKRYTSALTHVAKCEDNFEECLELVKEQRLYKLALKLFQRESDNYKSVCQCYAAYLEAKKYYEESSFMYEQSGDLEAAVSMAAAALRWQRAGHLARRAAWGQDKLNQLYRGLVERLEAGGRGKEAADLLRDWLQDSEEAVAVLARCYRWEEALRQARDICRKDLEQTHIVPALVDRWSVLSSHISSQSSSLSSHLARLLLVRAVRNNATDDAEVEDDRNVEDADMFSDTTSVGGVSGVSGSVRSRGSAASLQTRNSQRSKSSKNRRKADRKLYSTKEGSTYEDLGIMAEIHHILSGVTETRTEVGELVRALVDVGKEEQATNIQIQMEEYIKEVEETIPKVWTVAVLGSGGSDTGSRLGAEATVEDIIAVYGAAKAEYCSPVHLLEPNLRYPPTIIKDSYWKLEFLG